MRVNPPARLMARRHRAVRLGLPALFVGVLAVVALWRIGVLFSDAPNPASSASTPPLTRIADLITVNAVGRRASLEEVRVREMASVRTFWIADGGARPAFVVLAPDVRRRGADTIAPGAQVSLIGVVRAAPDPSEAMRRWQVDAATARAVKEGGTYLYATEVRGAADARP